jgi:hypothetical protein
VPMPDNSSNHDVTICFISAKGGSPVWRHCEFAAFVLLPGILASDDGPGLSSVLTCSLLLVSFCSPSNHQACLWKAYSEVHLPTSSPAFIIEIIIVSHSKCQPRTLFRRMCFVLPRVLTCDSTSSRGHCLPLVDRHPSSKLESRPGTTTGSCAMCLRTLCSTSRCFIVASCRRMFKSGQRSR